MLKKNCNPFALCLFIKTPTQMIKWRFVYIPVTPFYYKVLKEPVKHLSCSLLQKKLTVCSQKQKSTLDVWEDPKEYQLLLWWILPQILTPPLNLKIWCRIPAPSLITHPPHPTIKLPRIQIFKTGFRKLSILLTFWESRK